jgi:hypothetical protein
LMLASIIIGIFVELQPSGPRSESTPARSTKTSSGTPKVPSTKLN